MTYRRKVFRLVEDQYRISTSRLAKSLLDEERLELLADEIKPTVPPEARELHRLMATPFRYGYCSESRFRKSGERPGIFYASESPQTCLFETAYWRLRFYAASPPASFSRTTIEHLMFSVGINAYHALDLTRAPFNASRSKWTDPDNYDACQRLAGQARRLGTQLIRYESVRDPNDGRNAAVLRANCFEGPMPQAEGTWYFRFGNGRLNAFAASPSSGRHEFEFTQFGLAAR